MGMIKDVTTCPTYVVRQLDRQLIFKMNQIAANSLISFADLNVDIGDSVWPLLQPAAKQALARAIAARSGKQMFVNSAYRTIAQQLILFNHNEAGHRCGIVAAAPPGGSNHQSGLALDIDDADGWRPYLEDEGWQWLGEIDPVHFDYIGGDTIDIRDTAVLAFQQLWNENNPDDQILADGIFGFETEARLNDSPVDGFPKGERETDIKSTGKLLMARVLRLTQPNMEGSDVRKLQETLVTAGFKVEVDGFFGPNTESAVKQFQQKKRLGVDGVVGAGTRKVLGLG